MSLIMAKVNNEMMTKFPKFTFKMQQLVKQSIYSIK